MPVKTQALTGRLAPFRFMESPSLNGIAFNGEPQAQAKCSGLPLNDEINKPSRHRQRMCRASSPNCNAQLQNQRFGQRSNRHPAVRFSGSFLPKLAAAACWTCIRYHEKAKLRLTQFLPRVTIRSPCYSVLPNSSQYEFVWHGSQLAQPS